MENFFFLGRGCRVHRSGPTLFVDAPTTSSNPAQAASWLGVGDGGGGGNRPVKMGTPASPKGGKQAAKALAAANKPPEEGAPAPAPTDAPADAAPPQEGAPAPATEAPATEPPAPAPPPAEVQ